MSNRKFNDIIFTFCGPRLSLDKIDLLEKSIGLALPDDYRHFLAEINGGISIKRAFRCALDPPPFTDGKVSYDSFAGEPPGLRIGPPSEEEKLFFQHAFRPRVAKGFYAVKRADTDQEHYIQEWLLFHHAVGVERFVIVLHQCSDRTEEKILRVQKEFGYDIHIHHSDDSGKVQMGVYRWIARNYGAATEWLLFLDSDEFLFSDKVFDVKELLTGFERFGGLSVQQALFGPDGNIVRPWIPQIDAYKHRLKFEHPLSRGIKTFFQPKKLVDLLSPHIQQVRDGNVRADGQPFTLVDYWRSEEKPIHWPLRFNHYYTRSMQDWVQRCKRGSCNDAKTGNAYSVDEFMYITDQATEFDYAALRIMGQYQREIGLLRDSDKSTFSERINEGGMNNALS